VRSINVINSAVTFDKARLQKVTGGLNSLFFGL
jgi:hypothetical protein